jgi:histidine triad (HIT) family protein
MAADGDCIFCKIVAGEIPSERVDEDEYTLAFVDLNPWTRGHSLVIPKEHSKDLLQVSDEDLARTAQAAKRLSKRMVERLGCDGINLLNSCGQAAWQTIFHFHIHVIPRYVGDPLQLPTRPQEANPDELAKVAEELRGEG